VKEYPVNLMCKVLKVSRSGFYNWLKRPPCARAQWKAQLIEQIRHNYQKSRKTYGSPRITVELKARKIRVCENTVAKYMRTAGLKAMKKRRFVPRTTESNHPHPIAPNLLNREFEAAAPNRKWTCDITYIPTGEGWLYLAVVIDLFSRRIVGWNMSDRTQSDLVGEALKMAIRSRRPAGTLLHHSDRGVQYAGRYYQSLLKRHRMTGSMSRAGNCYDNAVTESFMATLKRELVDRQNYPTRAQARSSVFEWIEVFYNRKRRHSSLGYLSPEAFEAQIK
jgi:putative transposase